MQSAETIFGLVMLYLACGLLFAMPFVAVGVNRMDGAARNASVAFRLFILPGTVALWPLLAAKWIKTFRQGVNS